VAMDERRAIKALVKVGAIDAARQSTEG